jgi:hypothetical protein
LIFFSGPLNLRGMMKLENLDTGDNQEIGRLEDTNQGG